MMPSIYEPKDKQYEVRQKMEVIRAYGRDALLEKAKIKLKESIVVSDFRPNKNICPNLLVEKICDCPVICNVKNADCAIQESVPLVDEVSCSIRTLAAKEAEGATILASDQLGSKCSSFKRIVPNEDGSIVIQETPDQIVLSAVFVEPEECPLSNGTCTLPQSVPLVDQGTCTVKRLAMKEAEGAQILASNESRCATFKRIVPGIDGTILIEETPDQLVLSAFPECPANNATCEDPESIPLVDEISCNVKRLAMAAASGAQILATSEPNCALLKTITEAAVPPDPPIGSSIVSPIADNNSVYFRNIESEDGSVVISNSPSSVKIRISTAISPICVSAPDGETSVCVGNHTIETIGDNGLFMVPFNAIPPVAIPIQTNGSQMYFYPGKDGAFRAGFTTAGQWFDGNVGFGSFAQGRDTIAFGTQSHAEGFLTVASSNQAHAEGSGNAASGAFSHAEGLNSISTGAITHAEGANTMASNTVAHAEGFQTQATGITSHAEGDSTLASGTNSHAEGNSTLASGENSHSEGSITMGSGESSHSEGSNTSALNATSHAEGNFTVASGINSHAEGFRTTASNTNSHAEGNFTVASGINSHAEGSISTASNTNAHAEGLRTTASGSNSHAEGQMTSASDSNCHAEGLETRANAPHAHAEGFQTISGNAIIHQAAHAEGQSSSSLNRASHAEGFSTRAFGFGAHAEGQNTFAEVDVSHCIGVGTMVVNFASGLGGRCACGRFNADTVVDALRLFTVGNGNSDMSPSNAFSVRINGDCYSGGAGMFINGGADYAECFESQDGASIPPGTSVVLVGNKIVPSQKTAGYVLGVVSSNNSFLGNEFGEHWHGRFLRSADGNMLKENVEMEHEIPVYEEVPLEQTISSISFDPVSKRYVELSEKKIIETKRQRTQEIDVFDERGNFLRKTTIPITEKKKFTVKYPKQSPSYEPSRRYHPRLSRSEWHRVGLVGVVRLLKGQRTRARWYKMRDLDEKYEEWFIR